MQYQVVTNNMAPVPDRDNPDKDNEDNNVENMEMPQFVVAQGSSAESDDEDAGYQGYQLLPQDSDQVLCHYDQGDGEDGDTPVSNSNVDDLVISTLNQGDALATIGGTNDLQLSAPSIESQERKQLWSAPRDAVAQPPMDEDHAEKIKAAMSGFQLPKSHQPDWANVIPEEEWKTQLIAKLKGVPSQSHKDSNLSSDKG